MLLFYIHERGKSFNELHDISNKKLSLGALTKKLKLLQEKGYIIKIKKERKFGTKHVFYEISMKGSDLIRDVSTLLPEPSGARDQCIFDDFSHVLWEAYTFNLLLFLLENSFGFTELLRKCFNARDPLISSSTLTRKLAFLEHDNIVEKIEMQGTETHHVGKRKTKYSLTSQGMRLLSGVNSMIKGRVSRARQDLIKQGKETSYEKRVDLLEALQATWVEKLQEIPRELDEVLTHDILEELVLKFSDSLKELHVSITKNQIKELSTALFEDIKGNYYDRGRWSEDWEWEWIKMNFRFHFMDF